MAISVYCLQKAMTPLWIGPIRTAEDMKWMLPFSREFEVANLQFVDQDFDGKYKADFHKQCEEGRNLVVQARDYRRHKEGHDHAPALEKLSSVMMGVPTWAAKWCYEEVENFKMKTIALYDLVPKKVKKAMKKAVLKSKMKKAVLKSKIKKVKKAMKKGKKAALRAMKKAVTYQAVHIYQYSYNVHILITNI